MSYQFFHPRQSSNRTGGPILSDKAIGRIIAGIFLLAVVTLAVVITLWAYDGDVKCLVAECRRLK